MIEESLYNYLASITDITDIVDDKIYHHHLPQEAVFPVLTFQMISSRHDHDIQGAAGACTARYQVDCWSRSLAECVELAEAVRQALQGYKGTMEDDHIFFITLDDQNNLDEAPKDGSDQWLYRREQDYLIKYRESVPEA